MPGEFILPRIFFRRANAAAAIRRALPLPLRSANVNTFRTGLANAARARLFAEAQFPRDRYPQGVTYAQMPEAVSAQIRRDPNRFAATLLSAIDPAAAQLREAYNPSQPSSQPVVMHTPEMPDQGHFKIALTPVPMDGSTGSVESAVSDINTIRTVLTGGFPGNFASVDDDTARKIIAPDRDMDGALDDVLTTRLEALRVRNATQYAQRQPLSGLHSIGWNSLVDIRPGHHFVSQIGSRYLQLAFPVTTLQHIFAGGLGWFGMNHPLFPNHMLCGTIGVGEHPLSFGMNLSDSANGESIPYLCGSAFHRGMVLRGMMPQLIKELGDGAGGMGLDGRVGKRLRDEMARRQPWSNWDSGVLGTFDAMTKVMSTLHAFFPEQPVAIDLAAPPKLQVVEDIERATTSGNATYSSNAADYAPLQASVDDARADASGKLASLGGDLPWDFARTQVAQAVHDEVRRQVQQQGLDATASAETISGQLDPIGLRSAMARSLADFVQSGLADHPQYKQISDSFGDDFAASALNSAFTQPLTRQLAGDGVAADSYLQNAVRATALTLHAEALKEKAGQMQASYAAASQTATATRAEVTARESDLAQVDEKIRQGDTSADTARRRMELANTLAQLKEQLAHAEQQQRDNTPDRSDALMREHDVADTDASAAQHESEARAAEVLRAR